MTDLLMVKRGTDPADLPAGALLSVAQDDLNRLDRNRTKASERLECKFIPQRVNYEAYAFFPKHVRRAGSPAELLLIAAQADGPSETCRNPDRWLLYRSPERLVDAAEIALGVRR